MFLSLLKFLVGRIKRMILTPDYKGFPKFREIPALILIVSIIILSFAFSYPAQLTHDEQIRLALKQVSKEKIADRYLEFMLFQLQDSEKEKMLKLFKYQKPQQADLFLAALEDEYFMSKESALQSYLQLRKNEPLNKMAWSSDKLFSIKLISHLFVHSDRTHLIGNLFFLIIFGMYVEKFWGSFLFLTIFVSIGVLSSFVFFTSTQDICRWGFWRS